MKTEINNEEIIKLFIDGKSCSQIAKKFKCNSETIRLRLKKENIDTSKKTSGIKCIYCDNESRKEGKTKFGKQRYLCLNNQCGKSFVFDKKENEKIMVDKHNEIKKMYLIDKLSTTEIADKLGVSSTVPQRILKKYGLTRSVFEGMKLNYFKTYGVKYDDYLKSLPIYKRYKKDVNNITKKQNIKVLLNYNKRGLSGIKGAYQLDHKYSVLEGFKNDISPEIIGNINNLEFIPWEENVKKSDNCSITLEELYRY